MFWDNFNAKGTGRLGNIQGMMKPGNFVDSTASYYEKNS